MSKKKVQKKRNLIIRYSLKVILIAIIFSLFLMQTQKDEFTNTIPLLAVNENEQGNITGGSVIDLTLTITPGNGDIFVNANSLKEIDTQLSITNGHDTACSLFNLPCNKYNFYYTFKGTSVILKGPSATSSIALLTAKTINKEKINQKVAMTGSLNSAGVVGTVGGINEKIKLAEQRGYDKILIPLLANQNITQQENIEIKPVLDLVDIYNQYGGDSIELPQRTIDKTSYNNLMSSLVEKLCGRTSMLFEKIENNSYSENSSNINFYTNAKNNINSSKEAINRENYYSAASFCFSANNNIQTLIQRENNLSKESINSTIQNFSKEVITKKESINQENYIQTNIQTRNDFYVYLILQDRIHEAYEFLEPHLNSTTNTSTQELVTSYAFAKERYETIKLWEQFIIHQGNRISFTQELIDNACQRVSQDIISQSEVLEQYEITAFNQLIDQQQELKEENPYNCLYNGLELTGRINSVFYSYNIQENSSSNITEQLFTLTQSRIAREGDNNFPLIPFIYYEYAQELHKQKNYPSSLLYTNYALAFSNVDFYLQEPQSTTQQIIEEAKDNFLTNPLLILGLLLIVAFL